MFDIVIGVLVLGLVALLGWVIWTFVKDPSQLQDLFKKVKDTAGEEKRHVVQQQEEYRPSQEDVIRSIVREEVERMGKQIIRSIPQPANISQNDIINEIRGNRQLLERLSVSFDRMQDKEQIPESADVTPKQYPIIKYARMVDSLSPLGFQMASLSDTSQSACYQIIIHSENQATYHLITDSDVQSEIIGMFNPIITSGCEYDVIPPAINKIIHVADGQLELHSGVWQIVKRTKIRFI